MYLAHQITYSTIIHFKMSTTDTNSKDIDTIQTRRLLQRRDVTIKSMNTIKKYVERFNPLTQSCNQLQVRLGKLEELMLRFEECQSELEQGPDTSENLLDERFVVDDEICTTKATLLDLIEKHKTTTAESAQSTTQTVVRDSFKLPAILAPTFDGNLQQWSSFLDAYNAMFHNNPSLAEVQRLQYLKSCLTGPAAEVIRNIPTAEGNYRTAYEALVEEYENESLIIQSHVRSLYETAHVDQPSASGLRQLHQHVMSHVRALRALNQPVDQWDAWLVTLVCSKLDPITAGEWQLRQTSKKLPKFTDVERFLASRASAYAVGELDKSKSTRNNTFTVKAPLKRTLFVNQSNFKSISVNCVVCSGPHKLYMCEKFNTMSVKERFSTVSNNKLCYNCFHTGHSAQHCRYGNCKTCHKRHNTKLHGYAPDDQHQQEAGPSDIPTISNAVSMYAKQGPSVQAQAEIAHSYVLLATALIHIGDHHGSTQEVRAVLDSGSQVSFITQDCANRLKLKQTNKYTTISGIGTSSIQSFQLPPVNVSSRTTQFETTIEFYVLPVITSVVPTATICTSTLSIPAVIQNQLADPAFDKPRQIDALIGAEVFYELIQGNRMSISAHSFAHQTKLGWIITGKLPFTNRDRSVMLSLNKQIPMASDSALALLTSSKSQQEGQEEIIAEEHFKSTVTRNEHGRFVVRIPLKQHPSALGNSLNLATKRFFNLERKLSKDSNLSNQYNEFMSEYVKLGHMQLVEENRDPTSYNFLPHHAVVKDSSTTTKTRVVFDASAITSTGLSLNDIMVKGPTVQPTLVSTLLRFRLHRIALTADIEKMYRQILVSAEDCYLQSICYRSNRADTLKKYTLNTVTYGTKAAPFLATRCLVELSSTAPSKLSQRAIRNDFYVDDLLSGGESEEECFQLYKEVLETLNSAGMSLRKWCTSSKGLLTQLPTVQDEPNYLLQLNENDTVNTLGITWSPFFDCFKFSLKVWSPPTHMTKRSLLSDINKIYDPLGFITPVLIKGKIFLQKLWLLKLDWDTVLPDELCTQWSIFYKNMSGLQAISINRRVLCNDHTRSFQVHGFSDASQEAYGACIYIRSRNVRGEWSSSLVISRSRVAPIKQSTIPRLELCGAALLSELVSEVLTELTKVAIVIPVENIVLWTDSTIVLAWIKSIQPLKSFIANRVARILDNTCQTQWRHVPTIDNPADLISRGVPAQSLSDNVLWWNGPSWLIHDEDLWPDSPSLPSELPEIRKVKLVLAAISDVNNNIIDRFSRWMPLVRTTAWILRFMFNVKISSSESQQRHSGPLSVSELQRATICLVRISQKVAFAREFTDLSEGMLVGNKSKLKTLHPYIDSNGLIRVGGRLEKSSLPYSQKHPLVIPSDHKITKLLFTYEHERLLHAGPQLMMAQINRCYWPLRGKALARNTVHKCIVCFRFKPVLETPFMAPLPSERVVVSRAFARSGVDFCGPILIRSGIRRVVSKKCYVAVFVCFTTRAIHLELVSDLSTQAFLAALTRFMARRGLCSHIHSDNGTNFVGASKVLRNYFQKSKGVQSVVDVLANQGVQWHFIPPSAPHFGGLWEAAVKSAKHHLLKVTRGSLLDSEKMNTLLCKIEAILNSRPLTSIPGDPSDLQALTPSHFLIGGSPVLPAEPNVSSEPLNRLRQFEIVQAKAQTFWKRWSREYLPQLQKRNRWTSLRRSVQIGDVAILKEDNLPPLHWKLVRIVAVHPGSDGIIRVVTVKLCSGAELRRPTTKLALLPQPDEEDII